MNRIISLIIGCSLFFLFACGPESTVDRSVGSSTNIENIIDPHQRLGQDDSNNNQITAPGAVTNDQSFDPHEDLITEIIQSEISKTEGKADNSGLQELQKAMEKYNARNYVEAIPLIENYIYKTPKAFDRKKVDFYLAMCYVGTKQTGDAQTILSRLMEDENFEWKDDARWYLAGIYLDVPPIRKNAIPLLKSLLDHEKYGDLAQEQLKELE